MMFGLVQNRKKRIFKEKPELGTEEKCARFGFLGLYPNYDWDISFLINLWR